MKPAIIKVFVLLLTLLVTACITKPSISLPKYFNTDEFVGFISMNDDGTTSIDYELDGVDGNLVVFKNCRDVEKVPEANIVTHQYHLWRLLQVNCKAASIYQNSDDSESSYWPPEIDAGFIERLPADAIPDLGGNSLEIRKGSIKDIEQTLKTTNIDAHSIKVLLGNDPDITYVLLASGDFDNDGVEDILLRLDWHITTAFGKGFSLLQFSKPSISAKTKIVWRDG